MDVQIFCCGLLESVYVCPNRVKIAFLPMSLGVTRIPIEARASMRAVLIILIAVFFQEAGSTELQETVLADCLKKLSDEDVALLEETQQYIVRLAEARYRGTPYPQQQVMERVSEARARGETQAIVGCVAIRFAMLADGKAHGAQIIYANEPRRLLGRIALSALRQTTFCSVSGGERKRGVLLFSVVKSVEDHSD